jgi:molecular chaperone GrpE
MSNQEPNQPDTENIQEDVTNISDATNEITEDLAETNKVIEKTPEEKYSELYNEYLRLMAEFDNYRKRTIKERAELIKSAGSETIKSILPAIDDMERAIKASDTNQDFATLRNGLDLIYKKVSDTLKDKGLEVIETIGKDFDTEYHEAITNIPAQKEEDKGKVIDEIEKGYILNGKIIRFAKVVVAI